MPPNRKNVQGLVETLSSGDLQGLQDAVLPKYQPLTHPTEETKHLDQVVGKEEGEETATRTTATQPSHDSYWAWPADQDTKKAIINRILADEKARKLVSGVNIEKIELSSAVVVAKKDDERTTQQPKKENDDYWQWESKKVAPHVADPSHPSNRYWDWNVTSDGMEDSNKEKSAQIEAILEYEAARERMSADHIVQNLQSASSVPVVSSGVQSSSDDYWSW